MRTETSLHAALKDLYTLPGASQEALVDGYWIDVVQSDRLVEIQTRNFTALRNKLVDLIERHRVHVVYPVAVEKWLVTLPGEGVAGTVRRKSPYRGRLEHIFTEMVRIPDLLSHPNFSLEVILIQEEELRRDDGQGSWRRRGVSIVDRRLLHIVGRHVFQTPDDLRSLLPASLPKPFTNANLADTLHIPMRLAARMTYCLRALDILEITGKSKRQYLFRVQTGHPVKS